MFCSNCGKLVENDAQFCSYCGTRISVKLFCSNCGKELEQGGDFCPYCGTRITANYNILTIKNKFIEKVSVLKNKIVGEKRKSNELKEEKPKTDERKENHLPGKMNLLQDPGGFADLRLGETLTDIQASHATKLIERNSGIERYLILVPDAHGSLFFVGSVAAQGFFSDNKLIAIVIPFDIENFAERLEGIKKILGDCEIVDSKAYGWSGPLSIVVMQEVSGKGIISISGCSQNHEKHS